jgi:hypothetical protein
MNVIIIYFALTQNLSEVPEGAKQRGLCRVGVLSVRQASKRVATKHNGAYGKFYSTVTDLAKFLGLSTSQPLVSAA